MQSDPIPADDGRWTIDNGGQDSTRLTPIVHRPSSIVSEGTPIVHRPSSIVSSITNDRALTGGLAAALVAFALTFRGPRRAFWQRMTMTGLVLGGLALRAQPELRRTRISPKDLAQGLGSAAALYAIFQVGDRLARRILPMGAAQIESIYDLRTLRRKPEIAVRLVAVIGPAEELFWRGLVQGRLASHYGTMPGAVLATAAYGGSHIVTGNLTLIGAATVAGAFWGLLAAAGMPMGALIVSHVAWDLWIFLVSPTVPDTKSTA